MMLKQWFPRMNLQKDQLKKIPLWAQFYNVPLELWTAEGLSYVANAASVALYANKMTETSKRQSYAKIGIEVVVGSDLPESFDVILANNTSFPIEVWYPRKPLSCEKCW